MIRVLVVDDSAFVRQALARILSSDAEIEVVGTAADGVEAIEKAAALRPDVITLDILMPRMDGLEALERIMATQPVPVLLVSTLTREGADVTLRGLELGALDFIDKSSVDRMELLSLSADLCARIKALAGMRVRRRAVEAAPAPPLAAPAGRRGAADVVVIGTSTGGPPALTVIVPRLPASLRSTILVVQHMPAGFTKPLAERLAARSALPVREAVDGEPVAPGQVLIAPAGMHMKLAKRGGRPRVSLDEEPRTALHRPSADVLMASVARHYGPRAMGVILTGMGADGVAGLTAIRAAGGRTLAESEESCVVYGMPKAAIEAGVVDREVSLEEIADEIVGGPRETPRGDGPSA
jgi:two-component system, chemotaxis family, protein-glutamate methylesterase/glutaminase